MRKLGLFAVLATAFLPLGAMAQVDRTALPIAAPAFKGKIGTTFAESKEDFPRSVRAPKGAPNVVVVLIDDLGFGQPGTFGGPVPTPNLNKLAAQGLRYNRFHTTSICSPTRAAKGVRHEKHPICRTHGLVRSDFVRVAPNS